LTDTDWGPFRAIDDRAASAHIVALENPSADVEKTLKVLRDANIVCSSRNNRIRVSIAHFNNEADIRALAKILRQV
jgi:selenocysteine lyase/cysteine desulfurase